MTILNAARAVLDNRLASTPNVPFIANQNVPFARPESGIYIKSTFIPTSRRIATMGTSFQQRYQGLFRLMVCIPEHEGNGRGLEVCDTLLARFQASQDMTFNGLSLTIEYSEVGASFLDSPYYCTPINVAWYCYHA